MVLLALSSFLILLVILVATLSNALFPSLFELINKVAVADAGHLIRFLVTLILEACHGHALLSKHLRSDLICCVVMLNLRSLVHEQIEELLALLLHVTLVVIDEQWLHDELVEPVQVLGAAGIVSLRFIFLFSLLLVRVKHVFVRTIT